MPEIPAFHVEARKVCALCGNAVERRPNEFRSHWLRRLYCSRGCANTVNGPKKKKPPTPTPAEILAAHSRQSENGCVEWVGAKDSAGYGSTSVRGFRSAHRLAYFIALGPIPRGAQILHTCDNPACVTPDHLFLGTHADNMADKVSKNRQHRMPGEANGRAKLTAEQVKEIRSSPETDRALGRRLGISHGTVNNIRQRRIWRHI